MPNYDYKCKECGHVFEVFQKMSDPYLTECPKCGGKIRRLIGGGAGLIFKGSGFYLTDYKNKNSSVNSSTKSQTNSNNSSNTEKTSKTPETKSKAS